jgi:DNA-binding LacI/PurR family transcriptional regulator
MTSAVPTLDDVAARANVSRMTVSNVYNRPTLVAEATRQRVRQAAQELDYAGPSPAGRALRRGRAGAIGLVVADPLSYLFSDPGAGALMHGLTTQAAERDLSLQVIHATVESARQKISDSVVDAWIVLGVPAEHPAMEAVIDRRQRIVTTPGPLIAGSPCVSADIAAGVTAAIDHLVELGHERLAIVTPPAYGPIWEPRLAACRSAVERHGREWSSVQVVESSENSRRAGAVAIAEMLGRSRPTAVFAATDALALGVVDAARDAGLSVPHDLSVVGFDDIDDAATASPPLTTVSQDLFGQGQHAALLASQLDGDGAGPSARVFPAALVVRNSTAAPARPRVRRR